VTDAWTCLSFRALRPLAAELRLLLHSGAILKSVHGINRKRRPSDRAGALICHLVSHRVRLDRADRPSIEGRTHVTRELVIHQLSYGTLTLLNVAVTVPADEPLRSVTSPTYTVGGIGIVADAERNASALRRRARARNPNNHFTLAEVRARAEHL
jgi:hypothetical protein